MNNVVLTPYEGEGCPFPFFEEKKKEKVWYKIYNDGGHFVGTRIFSHKSKHAGKGKVKESIDICFDSLYAEAQRRGLKDTKTDTALTDFIKSEMLCLYDDSAWLDKFIADNIKRKRHNLYVRKKRFRRKAYLNKWNYFATFTFDDEKHSAETFRKKLRKCLSNLRTRRGWKCMGVFEYSPEKNRLHFHTLLYVPDGEMLGRIQEKKSYSPKTGKVEVRNENSFFLESFGVNDFTEINDMALKKGNTIDYLLKYIEKQGEKIVYSRGIPTEICKELTTDDAVADYFDFVQKYVFCDNLLQWERDIMRYNRKQVSIIDLICNPPNVA